MSTPCILVTGGNGFVGRPVLRELVGRGYVVHAADRAPSDEPGVIWHTGDLLDRDWRHPMIASIRPDAVIHLAWYVRHGKFWTAPENALWRGASLDLLDEFIASGGRRAVFVGSCAEYDWDRSDDRPWRETDPCRPATPYGRAKQALHDAATAKTAAAGVSFAWARLFLLFGGGENRQRLLPAIARALAEKSKFAMSSGMQTRDFSDTRDVAHALAALAAAPTVTGAVNIGSGQGIRIRDLALLAAQLLGGATELLDFGALPDRPEPPFMVADVTRLRQELKIAPPETLRDRLIRVLPSYLD